MKKIRESEFQISVDMEISKLKMNEERGRRQVRETPSPNSFSSHRESNSPYFNQIDASMTPCSKDQSSPSFNKEGMDNHFFSFGGNKTMKNNLKSFGDKFGSKIKTRMKYRGNDSKISSGSSHSEGHSTPVKEENKEHIFSFQNDFSDSKKKLRDQENNHDKNAYRITDSQIIVEDDNDLKTSTIREESYNRNSLRFRSKQSSNHLTSNENFTDNESDDEDLESVIENISMKNQQKKIKFLMSQSNKQSSQNEDRGSLDAYSKIMQKPSINSQDSQQFSSKFSSKNSNTNTMDMLPIYQNLFKNSKKQVNIKSNAKKKKPINFKAKGSFYDPRKMMMMMKENLSKKGKKSFKNKFNFDPKSSSQDRRKQQDRGRVTKAKMDKKKIKNSFGNAPNSSRGRLSKSQKNFLKKKVDSNYMSIDNFNKVIQFRGREQKKSKYDSGEKLENFLKREEKFFMQQENIIEEKKEFESGKKSRSRGKKPKVAVAAIDLSQVIQEQSLMKTNVSKTERFRNHHIKNSLRQRQKDDFNLYSYLSNSNVNASKLKNRVNNKKTNNTKKNRFWSRKRLEQDQKKEKSKSILGVSLTQRSFGKQGFKKFMKKSKKRRIVIENEEETIGSKTSRPKSSNYGSFYARKEVKSKSKGKKLQRTNTDISLGRKRKGNSRVKHRENSETIDVRGYLSKYENKKKNIRGNKSRRNIMHKTEFLVEESEEDFIQLDSPNPQKFDQSLPDPQPKPQKLEKEEQPVRDFYEILNQEQLHKQQENLEIPNFNFEDVLMDSVKASHKVSHENNDWDNRGTLLKEEWDDLGKISTDDNKENQMDYLNVGKCEDFLMYKESKETNDESLGNSFKSKENMFLKFGDGFRAKQKLPSSSREKRKFIKKEDYKFYNDFSNKLQDGVFQKIPQNESNRSSLKSRQRRKSPNMRAKKRKMCKLKIDIGKISSKAIGAIKKYN